jgi:23S rRNA pseudouridine955/2504/2580 synthase
MRTMDKYYLTLTVGQIREMKKIKGYLVKNSRTNKVLIKEYPDKDAQYIETEYEPIGFGDNITLLKVKLITGRAHQIRAHLSSINHQVIGDYKYGNKKINVFYKEKYGLMYQLLHSWQMSFPNMDSPFDGLSNKLLIADIPDVFKKIIDENIRLL